MKSLKPLAPTLLALLTACGNATAQQVYRCGNSYSDRPCAADAVPIKADDARSQAQRTAARQGLERDKALLKEMEGARHRDEALARKASEQRKSEDKKAHEAIAAGKSKKSARLRTVKVQEPGPFTAVAGTSTPKKTKARAKTSTP